MKKVFIAGVLAAVLLLTGCPSSSVSIETFTISYDANGADSGDVPTDSTAYFDGNMVTVYGNTGDLTRDGYIFNGWSTGPEWAQNPHFSGDTLIIDQDIILYANWYQGQTFTVTYNSNSANTGDVPVDSNNYVDGQQARILKNSGGLLRNGYMFSKWNTQTDGEGTGYTPGNSVTMNGDLELFVYWINSFDFRAINIQSNTWYEVSSTLRALGSHCAVFVEDGQPVNESLAQEIADEFDTSIYNQIVTSFGDPEDVDGNDRVILLLLDIQDGYTGSGGYVAGYFDPTHMFDTSTYENSNEADMLFVDTYPSVPGSQMVYKTIAHEFQHLINFSQTDMVDGREQDLWINEGLSSAAEYVYTDQVDANRIDYYNADPYGTILYGNNFFVWNGFWENDIPDSVLDNYATVNLFFQWLRIHSSNGIGIYKEILSAGYRDYRDVTTVAASRIDSQFISWDRLLDTWMIANLLCRPSGYLGYDGEITVEPKLFRTTGSQEFEFEPGEGIFSLIDDGSSGSYTPPSGSGSHIRYVGIDGNSGALDRSSPYSGHLSLVINTNTDNTPFVFETGYIANTISGNFSVLQSRSVQTRELPKSWAIDVQLAPGGGLSSGSHRVPGPSSGPLSFEELAKRKKAAK